MSEKCKHVCKIDYSRVIAEMVGEAAANLVGYVHHWQQAMKREIWKSNEELMADLGMTRYQFEQARAKIGTRIKRGDSKKELQRVRLDDGKLAPVSRLILYWKDRENRMWYWVNEELFIEYSGQNRGGLRSMPYKDYLQTDHWRGLRKRALDRAKHRCQVCNQSARLEVHHRTYKNRGAESLADLVVLCERCHETFHGNGALS